MKKILIVTRSMYKKGGVETALLNMLDNISPLYDIDLLCFSLSDEYKKEIQKIGKNIKIISSNFGLELLGKEQGFFSKYTITYYLRVFLVVFTRIFGNRFVFSIILKSKKIDKNYDYAISYMQAAGKNILSDGNNQFVLENVKANKKIVVIHSDYKREGFDNKYHVNLYSQFDEIIAVSGCCKKQIIECVPEFEKKTSVLHNFYNVKDIKNRAKEQEIVFDYNVINFITVARLSEEKGIFRMLNVIKKLVEMNIKNFRWHVIGGGGLYEEIVKLVKNSNIEEYVLLYGEKDNPYPYILNSDFLLVCSKYEAAPMVIGEAQILGIPVVSTETLSSREQIDDGKNGFVCDNSEEGIFDMLCGLLKKPEMIKELRPIADKDYNDQSLKELEKIMPR